MSESETVAVRAGNLQLSDKLLHEVVVARIEAEVVMVAINVDLGRLSVETRDVFRILLVGANLVSHGGKEGDGHLGNVLKLNKGCFILALFPVVGELLEAVHQSVHRQVLDILH